MFSTIKAKLIALIAVAMVAIVSISATGFIGMRNGSDAVRQYSEHRMPSLYGLTEIARGQLRTRVNNRDLLLLENDPEAQAKVGKLLEERLSSLAQIEKGGKIYEALPLEPEEAEVWKQFKSSWSEFLKLCNDVNPEMEKLAKAKSQKELAPIYDEIKKLVAKVRPSASALQLTLDKLTEMNDRQAALYAKSSAALMSTMTVTTNSASGIAIVLILLIGLYVFRSTMKQLGGEPGVAAEVANRIALGDFTSKIELKAGDTSSLMASMQQMSEKLSETITQVRTTAEELTNASTQVSSTSQVLSQATSEQAASLEETTSAIEQMSASIAQNTDNAKTTDGIARKSSEDALAGGGAVRSTVAAMKSIAGKISIIDDIAYRTDLLALNAAIEAARAGEHGKGFAVVAAEVRKLAERSQVAAQEIGELAGSSVDAAENAGTLLETMLPSIRKTADLVSEITAASEEQTTGVNQISQAMTQLNSVTQQNAASSEELSATAEEMSAQAVNLMEIMAQFKVVGGTMMHMATRPASASRTGSAKRPVKASEGVSDFEKF